MPGAMFRAGRYFAGRRLLLFASIITIALLGWHFLPLQSWTDTFLTTLERLGPLAPAIYATVYIVATLVLFPLAPLAIGAGYVLGLQQAFVVTLTAATLGAVLAFLISRHWLNRPCHQWLQPYPAFVATQHSIAAQGWLIVFLLRLSPIIPSHVLNYLCGISDIPLRHYLLATLFGKAPLIFLLSYIGAAAARTLDGGTPSGYLHLLLYGLGLLLTLLACWLVVRRARRELEHKGLSE